MPQAVEGRDRATVGTARPSCGSRRRIEDIAAVIGTPGPRPSEVRGKAAPRQGAPEAAGQVGSQAQRPRECGPGTSWLDAGGSWEPKSARWWRVSMTWRSTTMRRCPGSRRTSRTSSSRHQTLVSLAAARARAWTARAVGICASSTCTPRSTSSSVSARGSVQRTPRSGSNDGRSAPSSQWKPSAPPSGHDADDRVLVVRSRAVWPAAVARHEGSRSARRSESRARNGEAAVRTLPCRAGPLR